MSAIKKILVPVDGSKGSAKAAQFAANLSKDTGASVILATVYDTAFVSLMGMTTVSGKELDATIKRVSDTSLSFAKDAMGEDGDKAQTASIVGNPVVELVGYAAQNDIDMIVMGSRGRSPIKGALMGSVSMQMLYQAPCAVTIVRSAPLPPGDTASPGL